MEYEVSVLHFGTGPTVLWCVPFPRLIEEDQIERPV